MHLEPSLPSTIAKTGVLFCGAGVPVRETEIWYECCETAFNRVTFSVHLRRKPLYYIVDLILPCTLNSSTRQEIDRSWPPGRSMDAGPDLHVRVTVRVRV